MNDNINIFKNLIDIKNQKKITIENFDYENNSSFCMAPWIHLNISPNGNVPICCNCLNTKESIFGNINDNSLDNIWNSDVAKNIRLKMLRGEKIKECSSCYDREKIDRYASMRNSFNDKYYHKYKENVKNTKFNGEVEKTNIVYFDFRLSNKCNFSCRTCGPHYSSSWEKKLNANIPKIKDTRKILDKTKELIFNNSLEEIYFAGGETLIMDEHWEIIDYLIEQKKFNILIRYNTNLSVLNYKGNSFIEKIKLFNNVIVSPSCDSLGIKGEYIRTGFSNNNFIKNINLIKENKINYYITSVMSFFNIIHIYDFFNDLKNNEISYNNIHFIILTNTDLYSIYNLPPKVLEKTLEGFNKIIESDFMSQNKKEYFKKLYHSLEKESIFDERKHLSRINYIKYQDSLNKLKFKDCLPELYSLIEDDFN